MEGKSGFFILIGIIAFLTLALVLSVGYIFLGNGGKSNPDSVKDPEKQEIIVPKDDELIFEKMFEKDTPFNLKSSEPDKLSVILINAQLQYFKKVKGIKDTTVKVQSNKSKLVELIGTYFQGMSIEDVKKPDAKEKARVELTKKMNELLLQNEKEKNDIIYSIIFEYWFYQ